MSAFEAFLRTLTYAPNPFQNLDRTYANPPTGPSAARGEQLFNTALLDARILSCNQCHTASPGFKSGTNSLIIPGVALQEPQDFKVPQLRGVYQKVGMQKAPGEQLSGFGFAHDGNFDSLFNFLRSPVFTFNNDNERRDVAQFVLSFDTGIAPIVGVQVTANHDNKASAFVTDRINLLMSQVSAGNCDMVVRGTYGGARRGFLYIGNGLFQPDRQTDSPISLETLLQAVDSNLELTFTGVPLGTGRRLAIDRDANGVLNGDEAARPNPIDDTRFFIAQQYADFLKRDPDPVGNRGWQDILNNCAAGDTRCDRIEVSAGFFRSSEFQERGYFTYRFYSVALGRKPDYAEFIPDLAKVSGFLTDQEKEANKAAFADEFVQRAAFRNKYDSQATPAAYVDALLQTAGLSNHPSHDGWIAGLQNGTLTRARVLRELAESAESYDKFYTEAFVVMQYFGYLHRDPDKFYLDWIVIMNQDRLNYRNMVNGFMNSAEYRQRFGP
jgi:hypothetical protein